MAEEMPLIHEREMSPAEETLEATSREPASETGFGAEVAWAEFHRSTRALHLPIPEAKLSERLRIAVERAAARDADSMEALRLAVRSFTVALRDQGITPERVLITLKTVIHNRSFLVIAPHLSDWRGDQLREKITTWCIEEYFQRNDATPFTFKTVSL